MRNQDEEMHQVFSRSRFHRSIWTLILVSLFGLPMLIGAVAQEPSIAPQQAPASDVVPVVSAHEGDAIFHARCISCHNQQRGVDAPFGPPNLYTAFHGKTPVAPRLAANIIASGKGQMPAFGAVLTRREILCVVAYLRTR
jgi:mono/diheme cytochrome c family protein